jgi:hypothetical protein
MELSGLRSDGQGGGAGCCKSAYMVLKSPELSLMLACLKMINNTVLNAGILPFLAGRKAPFKSHEPENAWTRVLG